MKTISLTKVIIPENRIRRDFEEDKLAELADDIADIGLIHLPVLRAGGVLVSGERRYRAIKHLHDTNRPVFYLGEFIPHGKLPYASFESLSDLEASVLELHENIIRVNLPWQTKVTMTAKLHTLRKEQNSEWHPEDTRKELQLSEGESSRVSRRIILADTLSRPEVRAAGSEEEAFKALRKSNECLFTEALRKKKKKVKSKHTVIRGESVEWLNGAKPNQYDIILTDPPYGIDADKFGYIAKNNLQGHKYTDDREGAAGIYAALAALGYRIAKEQAHLYTFCSIEFFYDLYGMFTSVGWTVWPRPLIWYKHRGSIPKPDLGPQYVYECILFANKGNKPTSGLFPDVIDEPSVTNKRHAAEKPVEVYMNLLARSITPGDLVLDPFCGSGPIFPAAHRLDCIATGIDIDEAALAIANERIGELE